jgi:hypothetical protein
MASPDGFASPPTLLISLAQALRQASADIPRTLPAGTRFATDAANDSTGALVVTVTAWDARGLEILWSQAYDGSGRRRERPVPQAPAS